MTKNIHQSSRVLRRRQRRKRHR